jgi:hypothetical protein
MRDAIEPGAKVDRARVVAQVQVGSRQGVLGDVLGVVAPDVARAVANQWRAIAADNLLEGTSVTRARVAVVAVGIPSLAPNR